MNVVLRETVLLAITGILVGIAVSMLARIGIQHRWPLVHIDSSTDWMIRATLVALVGATIGSIYPAYKAAQKDPIDLATPTAYSLEMVLGDP